MKKIAFVIFVFSVFFRETEATHKPKQEQDVSRTAERSGLKDKSFAPINKKSARKKLIWTILKCNNMLKMPLRKIETNCI